MYFVAEADIFQSFVGSELGVHIPNVSSRTKMMSACAGTIEPHLIAKCLHCKLHPKRLQNFRERLIFF